MLESSRGDIITAWRVIERCPHRDPEDGTCAHQANLTPECNGAICPLANPNWERLAKELCRDVERVLDVEPDADGYRTVTVGPSEAEAMQDLVAELVGVAPAQFVARFCPCPCHTGMAAAYFGPCGCERPLIEGSSWPERRRREQEEAESLERWGAVLHRADDGSFQSDDGRVLVVLSGVDGDLHWPNEITIEVKPYLPLEMVTCAHHLPPGMPHPRTPACGMTWTRYGGT
jgi:hypothetical protein